VLCSLRWPEGHARGVMCVEIIKFGSIISLLNCLVFSPGFFPGDIPLSVCMLASCLEQLVFLTSVLHYSWSVLTQCQSLCSQTDSDSCTGPRAVLTLACPPPSWWSHVCVEVSFDRWLSRVRRSSPCTGPEAEFAITCLSSRGRYWMCLRGDCGVCVWCGVLRSPLQVTCRCRLFTPVVSCCSGRGVAGVVSLDGIGGLGESHVLVAVSWFFS